MGPDHRQVRGQDEEPELIHVRPKTSIRRRSFYGKKDPNHVNVSFRQYFVRDAATER